jgi:hypothetical protein
LIGLHTNNVILLDNICALGQIKSPCYNTWYYKIQTSSTCILKLIKNLEPVLKFIS